MLEANLHDKTLTELKVGETRMGKRVRPQGIVVLNRQCNGHRLALTLYFLVGNAQLLRETIHVQAR